jgi:hypothetical protein
MLLQTPRRVVCREPRPSFAMGRMCKWCGKSVTVASRKAARGPHQRMRRTHCVPDATLVAVLLGYVAHADNGTVSLTIYNAMGSSAVEVVCRMGRATSSAEVSSGEGGSETRRGDCDVRRVSQGLTNPATFMADAVRVLIM